jgi:tetratricopeptide (TPR) repeat protein
MSRIRLGTDAWIGVGLVALVAAVFGQAVGFELTTFDDNTYITDNPAVRAGLTPRSLAWALTAVYQSTWQPLTWLSLMADVELARLAGRALGIQPDPIAAVCHATNIALHAVNTCLLFAVLLQATGRRWESAVVAALFGVHPLHVESVAWVAERKDVLSTLFWFLAMLAHQRAARTQSPRARSAVAVALGLGLAAKPMLLTLPAVLLLWDWWPLGRLDRTTLRARVAEKLPLFALCAASLVATWWAQSAGGAMGSTLHFPLGSRLANAAISYVVYLEKTLWPTGLSFLYLHPGAALPLSSGIPAALALAVATVLALRAARRRPYVAVGWLWYGITLVPVIGLAQFGVHARADRFTYVPLIGVFVIAAWGAADWVGSWRRVAPRWRAVALGAAGGTAVLAAAVAAHPAVGTWRDSETLYRSALRVDPRNWLAHAKLADLLLDRHHIAEAMSHLTAALEVYPEYSEARYNLAAALEQQGKLQSAIAEYERLLVDNPDHALGHNNLGSLLARLGRLDQAIPHFEAAARLDPQNSTIRANLELARRERDGA